MVGFDWLIGFCEFGSGRCRSLGRISVSSCVVRDVQSSSKEERAEWEGPSSSGLRELGSLVLDELDT